ncbi:MAG: metallophosphoesterase [Hyphomicrobiaceae bacterium]|nr:metallophosphoesterase [Hyphomicrobiaceae bacterium]
MPRNWPKDLRLRIAVIADLHVCPRWMPLDRVARIVARTNALAPDIVLLPGDFAPSRRMTKFAGREEPDAWARLLAKLEAPLGCHAVLGNHDWWDDIQVQMRRHGPTPSGEALKRAGIPVYENEAVRLEKDGQPFWLAGLGDQWAFWPRPQNYEEFRRGGKVGYEGVDDLPATLAKVTDDAPILLMVHEPDIFPEVPDRVALTVCGHTHGGQISLAGFTPVVPSKFGSRYVYGHIVEGGRDLIVSGGLGVSGMPVRFGVPPEIVVIDLGVAPRGVTA